MQIEARLPFLLRATGVASCGAALIFLAPQPVLELLGMPVSGSGLFFARHWGLVIACIGCLLVYAARQPAFQCPILLVAAVEKLALALMVADLASPGLWQGIAAFDGLCVLLFSTILWRKMQAA